MKKYLKAMCLLLILTVSARNSHLLADRRSEPEVKTFLSEVESKLSEMQKSGAENFASEEIQRTIQYTARAKKFLSSKEQDLAYFELKKAAAHFRLINAKRRLYHAENDFYHMKKIITP